MTELAACTYNLRPYRGIRSRTGYSASCETCGTPCTGWTAEKAIAAFEEHRAIPAPPAEVLARPLTAATIAEFPHFYIRGRGRQIAATTDCGHGYLLTSSCPLCP